MATIILILGRPVFWLLLGVLALLLFGLAWWLRLRWMPAWAIRLALVGLALAGLLTPRSEVLPRETPQREVLVVDQSDSLSADARLEVQFKAQAWHSAAENRLVVAVGARPQVVVDPEFAWPVVDGRSSNLKAALEQASELLGDNPGRVILASDGQVSQPDDVESILKGLVGQGHAIDLVHLSSRLNPGDGFVGTIGSPSNIWAGMPFEVILPVYPPSNGRLVDIQLVINGQASTVTGSLLQENSYRFQVPAQEQGITTLQVTANFASAEGAPDPFPANDSAFAALQVFPAPRVLFLTARPDLGAVQRMHRALLENGLQVDLLAPERLPTDLETLQAYRVIFLHNLLASQLTHEQMLSLQVFVARLAGGLVFLGGRNSYTLGGYQSTMLEHLLPVKLEPPPRSERPPITFLLVMDRSASMQISQGRDAPRPINLAKEAALRVIETMRSQDFLGVLTFTDEFGWDVPIRELGSGLALREAMDAVSQVEASGGTRMYQVMQQALEGMLGVSEGAPASRHILLLSDGESSDGNMREFRELATAIGDQGISISTIAFGEGADADLMEEIAKAGRGRFYVVNRADDLPRIMVYESQAARSENMQAGLTGFRLGEADHPILSGMSLSMLPLLEGYNALSSKADEGAEDVLVSASFGDPILSAWQYGLGRVIAWSGDIGEEWGEPWPADEGEGRFWSQVVRYAFANPSLGPAEVNVRVESTDLVIEAAILHPNGSPADLALVSFTYTDPAGQAHSYRIPQVSAGTYRLEILRPPEGAYRGLLAYSLEGGGPVEVAASFAVNPPDEWLPVDHDYGLENLAAWVKSSQGAIVDLNEFAAFEPDPTPRIHTQTDRRGWRWLIFFLVILWPIEIAIRRRWLPWV